jgi:hypothetical protein
MAPTTIRSINELLDVLTAHNVPHAVKPDSRTVEIPARTPPLDSTCYIRWEKDLPYVQIICPMAVGIPPERHRDLDAAMSRANNAVAFPGFGLDHEHGTLYFRYTMAMFGEDGVATTVFQRIVLAVMNKARDFVVPFRQVIEGKPGDQILAAVTAYVQAQNAANAGSAFKD